MITHLDCFFQPYRLELPEPPVYLFIYLNYPDWLLEIFLKIYLFIYLFIYGCAGSSLLCTGFL